MLHSRRRMRRWLLGLWIGMLINPVRAIEPEDLRRGLVTTYRDAAKPTPAVVVRLEPQIALALKAGEVDGAFAHGWSSPNDQE